MICEIGYSLALSKVKTPSTETLQKTESHPKLSIWALPGEVFLALWLRSSEQNFANPETLKQKPLTKTSFRRSSETLADETCGPLKQSVQEAHQDVLNQLHEFFSFSYLLPSICLYRLALAHLCRLSCSSWWSLRQTASRLVGNRWARRLIGEAAECVIRRIVICWSYSSVGDIRLLFILVCW